MENKVIKSTILKGGEWLIKESKPADIFIPEDFTEEHIMIRDMCRQFFDTEVIPALERIDKKEPGLLTSLIQKSGELGIVGATCPEQYGGSGKDFITGSIVGEVFELNSFGVSFGAHKGIGTMPILYFGTEEQRKKYITKNGMPVNGKVLMGLPNRTAAAMLSALKLRLC